MNLLDKVKKEGGMHYETWEECKTKKSYLINLLGTTMQEDNYQSLRSRGVGQTTTPPEIKEN